MARGAKYSQSFRNGAQYDFSGRLLITADEASETQTLSGEKTQTGYKVQEITALLDAENSNQRNFAKTPLDANFSEVEQVSRQAALFGSAEASEIQSVEQAKSAGFIVVNAAPETLSTEGAKSSAYLASNQAPQVESVETKKSYASLKNAFVSFIESQTNIKLYTSVKDSAVAENQATDGVKSRTVTETTETALVENTQTSKTRSAIRTSINALVEAAQSAKATASIRKSEVATKQATNAGRVVSAVKSDEAALNQATNAPKTTSYITDAIARFKQATNGARIAVTKKLGFGVLLESAFAIGYRIKSSPPIIAIFGSRNPNPFTEYSTTELFDNPTSTSYTTENSAETFQENGVSSYEDGQ